MTNKLEARTFTGVQLRAAAGNDFSLVGVAASYDTPSLPIPSGPAGVPFIERLQPGVFARALREKQDVKALFNHDANYVLGRVKNGTLQLTDTDAGLAFRVALNPKSQTHQNIYASVRRGDIDACSFAFLAKGEKWSKDYTARTLTDVDLLDISVVTNPAYDKGTAVDARSAPLYVLPQDWRSRHLAALTVIERAIAADKQAAADPYRQHRDYLDELAEARRQGWM